MSADLTGIATTSLIVFAPVRSDARDRLPAELASLDREGASPFSQITGTHFARLVFVPALTGADDEQLGQAGAFLMLCADFDADLEAWTTQLCAHRHPQLERVLRCWEGFPGLGDATEATQFLARNHAPAGFTVAGYRRATVAEIREALRLRRNLRDLALRRQLERLDASALRDAWRRLVMP